jgi:MSHA biogenesis protein MshQ
MNDTLDSRKLQAMDMKANTTGPCGAACDAKLIGSSLNMRYGRLRLDDAFGPETHPLKVNFATEYWTGKYFSLNTDDSCTQVLRSAITYPAGNILTDGNRTVSLTGGSTTGTYVNLTSTHIGFNAGTAGQEFTSPAGGRGEFEVAVDLTNLSWLTFDWDQNNDYSDVSLPNATFTFGSYRGNDRVIYWRERLQ